MEPTSSERVAQKSVSNEDGKRGFLISTKDRADRFAAEKFPVSRVTP